MKGAEAVIFIDYHSRMPIYEQIKEIIESYRPDQVAIEKLFFNQN